MIDYTLNAYRRYLSVIKKNYPLLFTFAQLLRLPVLPENFCALRHDVDRDPKASLRMARLENEMQMRATYYFRTCWPAFNLLVIKEIHTLGHDIGYHYESLSTARGNMDLALADFDKNLQRLRRIIPVKTIAMHGRPLSRYDNRDLWRNQINHDRLLKQYQILGEIYLDLDYSDIAYITDASREWGANQTANIRDHVNSNIVLPFSSGSELLRYLDETPPKKLIWQIHPERWHNNPIFWTKKYCQDLAAKTIKRGLKYFNFYSYEKNKRRP